MLAELLRVDRAPVSLETVLAQAPAMTRIDRKYLVPVPVAREFVGSLPERWRALAIGDRTSTHYHSRYFDTRGWQAAREHVQRRRRRWKVRRRSYLEDGLCRLEVKTKDGRGHTVKALLESPQSDGGLTAAEREFVAEVLGAHRITLDPRMLRPSMEISYERMTLARTAEAPARLTLDWQVECTTAHGRAWVDEEHVLVETKGGLRPSDADRLLLQLGCRPRWFSKYTAAACLLAPGLPDNDVRALCGRHLHAERPPLAPEHVA